MEVRTRYSATDIVISRLGTRDDISRFSCGNDDIDDFFRNDVIICTKNKYVSAYKVSLKATGDIVGLFTLSNDAIIINGANEWREELLDELQYFFPEDYHENLGIQAFFPAVNIGHLAIACDFQLKGIGSCILDYIFNTFKNFKVTGCQFITVDALNNKDVNAFYHRHNFLNMYDSDISASTRRMYLPIVDL